MTLAGRIVRAVAIGLAILLFAGMIAIAVKTVQFFAFSIFGSPLTGETVDYSVDGSVSELEIDIAAAEIRIETGDTFSVRSNLRNLKVQTKDGVLSICFEQKRFGSANNAFLTLTIPNETEFDKIRFRTAAGTVDATDLTAKRIDFDLGAGNAKFASLTVTESATVNVGAGAFTVEGGSIRNPDFDLGVGKTDIRAQLFGSGTVNCGVGTVRMTLIGTEDEYALTLNKGIGSITVSDREIKSSETVGTGSETLRIDGAVGSIRIDFEPSEVT